MPKPPHDPGSGPRIRARARGGSSNIRPEVADALGGVERSLSEVAKWEQMLAGRTEGGPVVPALPEGYVGLTSEEVAPADEVAIEIAEVPEDPEVREVGILDAVRAAEEEEDAEDEEDEEPQDAAAAADALVAPLLAEFRPEDAVEEGADDSVLWAARTVEEPAVPDEVIAKRRRHARILSWAGALILIAGAALWLVPDRSDDGDELPAIDVTSTTRSDTNLLDQTDTTLPTTTPSTTPSTTETTRRTTATTARRSAATTPATSPPTSAPPGSTLPLPGPPGTVNPSRTVPTTAPPTTAAPTTTAPTTTTTANTVPLI